MARLRTKLNFKNKVSQQKASRIILSLLVLGVLTTQMNQDKGIELAQEEIAAESIVEVESDLGIENLGAESESEALETSPQIQQKKVAIASTDKTISTQAKSLGVSSAAAIKKTTSAANITHMEMSISGHSGELSWASSYQRNIKSFIIERSIDDEEFEVLGQVKGQGIGEFDQNAQYKFEDTTLMFVQMPRVFYRLKQVGTGGDNAYSDVVEQDLSLPIGLYAQVDIDQNKEIQIRYAADKTGPINYKILNAFGEPVSSNKLEADFDPKTLAIDASSWSKGAYYLTLTDDTYSFMEAFYLE